MFAVNVLAPYLLTALIDPPRPAGLPEFRHAPGRQRRPGRSAVGRQALERLAGLLDSKLFDMVLAFAVARRWPGVLSNALEPGWVPTRMGGPGAPDECPWPR